MAVTLYRQVGKGKTRRYQNLGRGRRPTNLAGQQACSLVLRISLLIKGSQEGRCRSETTSLRLCPLPPTEKDPHSAGLPSPCQTQPFLMDSLRFPLCPQVGKVHPVFRWARNKKFRRGCSIQSCGNNLRVRVVNQCKTCSTGVTRITSCIVAFWNNPRLDGTARERSWIARF
jgi:hypothetical protein